MHDGRQPWLAVAVTKLVFSSNHTWNPRSTPPSPRSLALQGPTWSCFIGFSKSNHIRACAITTFGPTHANWPLVIFKIAGCPSTAQHHHQTQNLICARNSQFLAFKCYLNELKFPFSFSNRATSRWISPLFLILKPQRYMFRLMAREWRKSPPSSVWSISFSCMDFLILKWMKKSYVSFTVSLVKL